MRHLLIAGLIFTGAIGLVQAFSPSQVTPIQIAQADERIRAIAGNYRVLGRNANGSRYSGQVLVSAVGDKAYFRWQINNDVFQGQGKFENGLPLIYWGQPEPVVDTLAPGGELAVIWNGGRANETLTSIR
ncbi:MAG: hypothetical protein AAGE89_11495 [Pseudomonadota bacterium]